MTIMRTPLVVAVLMVAAVGSEREKEKERERHGD